MKDLENIMREKEGRANLSQYKDLIETVCKVEYKKLASLGLIELSEIVALANYTIYYLTINAKEDDMFSSAYLTKAIKWAIRNEMRRRYKWYIAKNDSSLDKEQIKDAVYKTILSIDEISDAENPTQIKDNDKTPEEKVELIELKHRICELMKNLSPRERELVEAKYFYDKKLKDISVEFDISQSRISRIIQNALDKIKKGLLKQEEINEDDIREE